jgi:hypothetical protein
VEDCVAVADVCVEVCVVATVSEVREGGTWLRDLGLLRRFLFA